jgi:mRNA interferase RelE/StbE
MSYKLIFKSRALKEWRKLDASVREQFKKKLLQRIESPRVESARLSGLNDCYKIKLRAAGYRLVYEVRDEVLVVTVVAVGKRERNSVYKAAEKRI